MEWLRGIAATAGTLLCQEGGQIGRVVREVGGTLRATHMDGDRIRAYFGRRRKVVSTDAVEKIAREGVPAEVGAGGNLGSELAYGNHRSTNRGAGRRQTEEEVALPTREAEQKGRPWKSSRGRRTGRGRTESV